MRGICSTCKAPVTETVQLGWIHDYADDDYADPATGKRIVRNSTDWMIARHVITYVEAVA